MRITKSRFSQNESFGFKICIYKRIVRLHLYSLKIIDAKM